MFNPKVLKKLVCPREMDIKESSDFEKHPRIPCDLELTTLRDPFDQFDLTTGRDEILLSRLEKLFVASKRTIGSLRGSFFVYQYRRGKKGAEEKKRALAEATEHNVFDTERYKSPRTYCVRVYVLRGLGLISHRRRHHKADPYVVAKLGKDATFKSDVCQATINPNFFCSFDFDRTVLPGSDNELSIELWDDGGLLGDDLLGETVIPLETRVFSKIWFGSTPPVEKRALFGPSSNTGRRRFGRLPQGFIEVCVSVVDQKDAAHRYLDYLLQPPRRVAWQLRATLIGAKDVTAKKVYHTKGEGCCAAICLPPDQSDVMLGCTVTGPHGKRAFTDIHRRSVDGEAAFNWRTIHTIELPAPEPFCNLKVQIWNVNVSKDDWYVILISSFFWSIPIGVLQHSSPSCVAWLRPLFRCGVSWSPRDVSSRKTR